MMNALDRRGFMAGGVAVAVASKSAWKMTAERVRLRSDLFTQGVASGDPVADGVVIWTRLAPRPLSLDGHGGMPARAVDVDWQVARDARFGHVVTQGSVRAVWEWGHSVHAEVHGLAPDARYFYRFRTRTSPTYMSPTGMFRTAPPAHRMGRVDYALANCANYQHGYYHAYQAIADDVPDFVLFLGDYIYDNAYAPADGLGVVRKYYPEDVEADDLSLYRLRYSQQHTDAELRAARAATAWIAVHDDHDLHNNWTREDIPSVRAAAAFQAWYENMPMRLAQKPAGSRVQLYRRFRWGALAKFNMLDTRQYRDPLSSDCGVIKAPDRTMTGERQERWLLDGFTDHSCRWSFLGQQVPFSQRTVPPGEIGDSCHISADKWDGYQAQRDRIARAWGERGVRNMVVLTGDTHKHMALDVSSGFGVDDPLGAEVVCTSISTEGNSDRPTPAVPLNPNFKWARDGRGYVRCRLTPTELVAEYMDIADVRRASYDPSGLSVAKSFVVEDGKPGIEEA